MVSPNVKGGSFEREVCKALSLWVTRGKRIDIFYRAATSGGRATFMKGKVQQAGDVVAVEPEGFVLTDAFLIECKHRANLELDSFIFRNTGLLAGFWKKACQQAEQYKRGPMIIARQNFQPTLLITEIGARPFDETWVSYNGAEATIVRNCIMIRLFDEVLKYRFRPQDAKMGRVRMKRDIL